MTTPSHPTKLPAPLESLGIELETAILSSDVGNTALNLIEVGIDTALDSGALRDIPVLGTVVGIGRLGMSVSDFFLIRKLRDFLSPLSSLTPGERRSLSGNIAADPKYARRVGIKVAELLNRVDSDLKPQMIGACFAALAKDEIDVAMLQRLTHAIEMLPPFHLADVSKFHAEAGGGSYSTDQDYGAAIHRVGMAEAHATYGGAPAYSRNAVCDAYIKLGLHLF